MQVIDVGRANDGYIKLIIDDSEVTNVGCMFLFDVQLNVVSVWSYDEDDVDIDLDECFIVDDDVIDVVKCDVDVDGVIVDLDVDQHADNVVCNMLDVYVEVDDHDDVLDEKCCWWW